MTLSDYYQRHPRLIKDKTAYLEKEFLENVFYPEYGSRGLSYLEYQEKVYDGHNRRNYYIDFAIHIDGKKYAIEIDGYNYHGKMSAKDFDRQEERTNEITRQGYELIRFSFNKIKNKPMEARRELRRRISLPEPQTYVAYDASGARNADPIVATIGENHNESYSNEPTHKKELSAGIKILIIVIVLAIVGAPIVLIGLMFFGAYFANSHQEQVAESKSDIQKNYIQSFVDNHNSLSENKIDNLVEIDRTDEAGQYYRSTNTSFYASSDHPYTTMHGTITGGEIWLVSCSVTDPSSLRLYAETTNYDILSDLVHVSIPYLNPDSSDNTQRLGRFDSMIQSSNNGLYIEYINASYVVLKQNNENTGVIYDKDKASNWRLNINTKCSDLWY